MRRLSRVSILFLLVGLLPTDTAAQPPAPPPKIYARGHKIPTPEEKRLVHAMAAQRHNGRMSLLPVATPAQFDCGAQGWLGPVDDQGQCGSCWDVATCDQITNGMIKAGLAPKDGSFRISPQYILDKCGPSNGGCNGDWGTTVLRWAKSTGIPSAGEYGPYQARAGVCRYKQGMKLYQIKDWGFCTPGQEEGMSTVQDIKNAMTQFGAISCAVAANSDWDNYRAGTVMPYRRLTANDVNHEVQIVGWDDSKAVPGTSAKGAWRMRNQWGTSWGDAGYAWIGYNSHQLGTEATWVSFDTLPPVPPIPPDPPVPPTPGTGFTGTVTQVYENGSLKNVVVTPGGKAPTPADLAELEKAIRAKFDEKFPGVKAIGGVDIAALIKAILEIIAAFQKTSAEVPCCGNEFSPIGFTDDQAKSHRCQCGPGCNCGVGCDCGPLPLRWPAPMPRSKIERADIGFGIMYRPGDLDFVLKP